MAQWNPFEDLASLRREIDQAFEGFSAGQSPLRQVAFLPGTGPRRYPLINLRRIPRRSYAGPGD